MPPKRRRGRGARLLFSSTAILILLMGWNNLQANTVIDTSLDHRLAIHRAIAPTMKTPTTTKILGFSDYNYREYAIRWYHRLASLGYSEQVVVAVDKKAVDFFRSNETTASGVRWEALPYPPCVSYKQDKRGFRRQIFGRRWAYIYEQLQQGHSILMTDVDNVFLRYLSMKEFEHASVDIFHAYSTSYPIDVFEQMGFTVCGGMSWLRSTPPVINFVGSLVNKCGCKGLIGKAMVPDALCRACTCDDQVVLNELLWSGKHKIIWDRNISKPTSLKDYPWEGITGVSSKTKHRVAIWDRNLVYRAVMPDKCPPGNWVAAPLYVDRGIVLQTWEELCKRNS